MNIKIIGDDKEFPIELITSLRGNLKSWLFKQKPWVSIPILFTFLVKGYNHAILMRMKIENPSLYMNYLELKKCKNIFFLFNGKKFKVFNSQLLHSLFAVKSIIIDDEYHLSDFDLRGKVVIDAGANIGVSTAFMSLLGAKVFSFEPVKETFKMLKEGLKDFDNIKLFNKALGEEVKDVIIYFDDEGDIGASITKMKKNKQIVEMTTIDKEFESIKVDVIKIDVEGYEENVIKGAEKIIKRDKPILIVCAYHNKGDENKLKDLIKRVDKKYDIKILNENEKIIIAT